MRSTLIIGGLACGIWLAGGTAAPAQTNPPTRADVLMQLMLTQPATDLRSPVQARAVFDPPVVGLGGKVIYRVTLNALESSVQMARQVATPPGLKLAPTARGQIMQPLGNALRPLTALNFDVQATRPGFYTVPEFAIEIYGQPVLVPAASLEVAARSDPADATARQIILELAHTNVFVGESVKVRVCLPGTVSHGVEGLTQLQFNGDFFLADKSNLRQEVRPMELQGRRVPTFQIETSVTPIATGPQNLSAQAFTTGKQMPGANTPPMLLDSDPVMVLVRPLPPESTTKGFTGFIGNVTVDRPRLGTNTVRVGDTVLLVVTFHSEDSLARLVPPVPPRVAGWQIFPPAPAEVPPPDARVSKYSASFAYTLIPLTEEIQQTPEMPFSCFDPVQAAYRDLTVPPLPLTVTADGLPTDWKPESWANEAKPRSRPALSALAESPGKSVASLVPLQLRSWFFLGQLVPAGALTGLWLWDRQRRFLERHPELERRRRARRALRREKRALHRAAAKGDAPGFVRRAVAALQIAAAPHFPAEPRALVCGEVLSLFNTDERSGRTGEVIRSLFSRDAAESFGAAGERGAPLLNLKPELEGILERMEARL